MGKFTLLIAALQLSGSRWGHVLAADPMFHSRLAHRVMVRALASIGSAWLSVRLGEDSNLGIGFGPSVEAAAGGLRLVEGQAPQRGLSRLLHRPLVVVAACAPAERGQRSRQRRTSGVAAHIGAGHLCSCTAVACIGTCGGTPLRRETGHLCRSVNHLEGRPHIQKVL